MAHDPGDPILNTWILWWNAQALPFTARWWNAPIFFPMPDALALSEHLAGIALITTPLQFAGFSALAAYNSALILSFALSGFFAYLLVQRLTGSTLAAACAGLAYGFAPYRAGQLAHLQVLTSQWMPVALLALHSYVRNGRPVWLAVFAAAWLVQALSNGYYLLFFPLLLSLWLAWFVDWRRAARRGAMILAVWIGASLLLAPMLLEYAAVHGALGLTRPLDEIRRFSATARSFAHPAPMLAFWPSSPGVTEEDYLFPGVTAIGLIGVAATVLLVRHRRRLRAVVAERSPLLFYACAALTMWALALGPAADDAGLAPLTRPYTPLAGLPGFGSLRSPARLAMLATLCLSAAAGIAVARLAPARRGALAAFGAVVVAGLLADGWMRPMPLFAPPARANLPEIPHSVVIELPADDASVAVGAMYRAMSHRRPLASGYSGHVPPHYVVLSTALRRDDSSVLTQLARGRPLVIVVDNRRDPAGDFLRLVRDLPGVEHHEGTAAGAVFVLPALPRERVAPPGALRETTLQQAPDGDPSQASRVDLGAVRVVRTIEFPMRWRYPSLYTRMAVETSLDGAAWTTAWEDWTGGPALAAVLRDPREAPVRITLADVSARYIRASPAPAWVMRELRVHGP